MHTITAIETQSKNPRRVNIYLDGEFALGMTSILAAWLRVGQEISDEKLAALKADEAFETMKQKSLHFMGYRLRSCEEVRRNLISRGCDKKMAEEIIQYHQQSGGLDDKEFTRAWVDNRNAFRQRSKSVLRLELLRKGINEETIQSVLEESTDDNALALEAARKQARRFSSLDWNEFRRKLGGFLARRGFSYATLAPIVSQVWKEIQAADSGRIEKTEDTQYE